MTKLDMLNSSGLGWNDCLEAVSMYSDYSRYEVLELFHDWNRKTDEMSEADVDAELRRFVKRITGEDWDTIRLLALVNLLSLEAGYEQKMCGYAPGARYHQSMGTKFDYTKCKRKTLPKAA